MKKSIQPAAQTTPTTSTTTLGPGLVVITHNGRLPSEGGRRIGYYVQEIGILPILEPIAKTMERWQAMHKPAPASTLTAPVTSVIDYGSLLEKHGLYCPYCDEFLGRTRGTLMETDKGKQHVVTCTSCGRMSRPWE